MKTKLIFLDIDGTLTPPGSNIPPQSAIDAVRKAKENGHRLFLCTGRNLGLITSIMPLGFEGAVTSAGGYVFAGSQVLFDCPMTDQQRDLCINLLRQNHVYRNIESKDTTYCDDDLAPFLDPETDGYNEQISWRRKVVAELGIRPIREYAGQPLYKVLFTCQRMEQIEPLKTALGDAFRFVIQDTNGDRWLEGEIINRRFDKGRGIRMIAAHLGFDLADTIGFGDSLTDLEMIRTVGTSICMENGSPALKDEADFICPPFYQDGLADAFSRLHLI